VCLIKEKPCVRRRLTSFVSCQVFFFAFFFFASFRFFFFKACCLRYPQSLVSAKSNLDMHRRMSTTTIANLKQFHAFEEVNERRSNINGLRLD